MDLKDEYLQLRYDDELFAEIWQDTEEDFKEWVKTHGGES